MSVPSDPSDASRPTGVEAITEAADRAREHLHAEIERIRAGIEERGEDRLDKAIRGIDDRTRVLEQRLDAFEREREYAEWRIHKNTEAMLDGLLREIRYTADLLTR